MEKIVIYEKHNSKYKIVKLADVIIDIKDGGTPPRKKKESEVLYR